MPSPKHHKITLDNLNTYLQTAPEQTELDVKVGEKVAYTRHFLMQTCVPGTDPAWVQIGIVCGLDGPYALVQWMEDTEPVRVRKTNLAYPGINLRYFF